jgi:hypothetical protein
MQFTQLLMELQGSWKRTTVCGMLANPSLFYFAGALSILVMFLTQSRLPHQYVDILHMFLLLPSLCCI